jgi:two-component system invasion response regulator UvrY
VGDTKFISLYKDFSSMHQILIVDDHAIVRTGLEVLISQHLEAETDTALDGKTALKKIKEKDYELLILDINMPDTDCGQLISTIQSLKPELSILIFSMNEEALFAMHYLKLGARGFLSKNSVDEEIIYAIKQILKGKKFISAELVEAIEKDRNTANTNPFQTLSERELTVTHQLLKGKNILEISEIMNLHTSTVGTYRTRIFEKLGIKSLIDLAELARIHHFL